ncbi:MAG: DUF6382 domain-containing protein [Oscillospiraceae bacterium]|jgi:hypothetical protein|nr:DUF6382 domain-containing protein [Oscillospiraceae bacterium]
MPKTGAEGVDRMKLGFETQGVNTYLICRLEDSETIDTFTFGMITNTRIPGLSPVLFTQIDDARILKYNISSKISLRHFLGGQVNKKRLLGVFSNIAAALASAEEYMLESETFLFDVDNIYTDVSTCEVSLICLPVRRETGAINLVAFFKDIMFNTQFDQSENCDYVAQIINYLNSVAVFLLPDFKKKIDSLIYVSTTQTQVIMSPPPPAGPAEGPVFLESAPLQAAPVSMAMPAPLPPLSMPSPPPSPVPVPPLSAGAPRPAAFPGAAHPAAAMPLPMPPSPGVSRQVVGVQLPPGLAMPNSAALPPAPAGGKPGREKKESKWRLFSKNPNTDDKKGKKSKKVKPQKGAPAAPGMEMPLSGAPPMPPPAMAAPPPPSMLPLMRPAGPTSLPPPAPADRPLVQRPVLRPMPPPWPPSQAVGDYDAPSLFSMDPLVSEGTTLLEEGAPMPGSAPHLFRLKTQEKIYLTKPLFKIGKEKNYADYTIRDNSAVSRSHLNVIMRGGEVFIVDTNSKNHTFLNDVMIASNVEVKLPHGARVRLANEEFEFRLY